MKRGGVTAWSAAVQRVSVVAVAAMDETDWTSAAEGVRRRRRHRTVKIA